MKCICRIMVHFRIGFENILGIGSCRNQAGAVCDGCSADIENIRVIGPVRILYRMFVRAVSALFPDSPPAITWSTQGPR